MILLCTECMKWDYFHNAINRPGDLDSVQSIFPNQIHIKFKQALQHNISACGAHEYAPIYNLLTHWFLLVEMRIFVCVHSSGKVMHALLFVLIAQSYTKLQVYCFKYS